MPPRHLKGRIGHLHKTGDLKALRILGDKTPHRLAIAQPERPETHAKKGNPSNESPISQYFRMESRQQDHSTKKTLAARPFFPPVLEIVISPCPDVVTFPAIN
jgi:hypothetical protein